MNSVASVMAISIVTNIFLAVSKIICGIIFSSGALIADGIHSFSDLTTDIFAIIGNYFARKPADSEHPFGHGKIEYLTSIVIGGIVLFVGFGVIYSAVFREIVVPDKIIVVVCIITILSKFLLSRYIINKGIKLQNNIMIASGKESRADVISSLVVFMSAISIQFSDKISLLKYSDVVASVIVGIFIVRTGFMIIKENISVILGEQEKDNVYLESIRDIILTNDIVLEIKDMVIVKYGHTRNLSLIITMNGKITLNRAHNIVDIIEKKIKKYDRRIQHINIHMEPVQD
jgi:cation diffusion facilitator family transporter